MSLVSELLRRRGRELLAHPDLHIFVAEDQWGESRHELRRRLAIMVEQKRIDTG